jgi:hypothetical protein
MPVSPGRSEASGVTQNGSVSSFKDWPGWMLLIGLGSKTHPLGVGVESTS